MIEDSSRVLSGACTSMAANEYLCDLAHELPKVEKGLNLNIPIYYDAPGKARTQCLVLSRLNFAFLYNVVYHRSITTRSSIHHRKKYTI